MAGAASKKEMQVVKGFGSSKEAETCRGGEGWRLGAAEPWSVGMGQMEVNTGTRRECCKDDMERGRLQVSWQCSLDGRGRGGWQKSPGAGV